MKRLCRQGHENREDAMAEQQILSIVSNEAAPAMSGMVGFSAVARNDVYGVPRPGDRWM